MKCLITGCHVHSLLRNEFAYGDLYELGDVYVLIAATRLESTGTYWMPAPRGASDNIVLVTGDVFDKRGVLVFSKKNAVMNDAAKRQVHGDGSVTL